MKTWTATTTVDAAPEAVLDVLTDPDAIARWAPLPFDVDDLDTPRLMSGSTARVSGRLAGRRVGFVVEVFEAEDGRLSLAATGPVGLDVNYDLARHRRAAPRSRRPSPSATARASPAASSARRPTPSCPPARSPTPSRASRRSAACPA